VAVSPWLVLHSQEARSYALLTLLAGLSFLFFARSLRAPSGAQIGWWAVTSGLALATHYFAIFLVAPEAVWLLVASRRRGPVLLGVAAVTAVGAALLPLALHQRSEGNPDAALVHGGSLALRIIEVPKQSLVGFDGPAEIVTAVAAAALCAVSLFFLATGSSPADRQRLAPAAGIGLAAVAAPLLVAFVGLDYLVARNLIVAWVPFAVVVAAGLSATRLRTVGLVVTAALTALFATVVIAVAVDPSYQRADWRGAAASLGAPQTSRAIVVQPPTAANTYRIYLPGVHALPRHGARVSEIDLITVASYLSAPGRARRAPNPKALPAPFPGFREVGRRHEQTYTVVRYGSPAPRLVMPTALAQRGLKSHRRSSVLYQGAVPTIATP